jgi:hypothetical protein
VLAGVDRCNAEQNRKELTTSGMVWHTCSMER